jgi:hypothetical protein
MEALTAEANVGEVGCPMVVGVVGGVDEVRMDEIKPTDGVARSEDDGRGWSSSRHPRWQKGWR